MRIDSHQHFWNYHPVKDAWITDDMQVIQKDFLPADLFPLLEENEIDGCVAVQSDQSEAETDFLLSLANENDFIKGVVGWVDLRADNLDERLAFYANHKKLKGFRHIVQGEPEDDFLLRDDFCKGIEKLSPFNFTYDILIFPKHLKHAATFVKQFPDQHFVIDHLAKPDIKNKNFAQWENDIQSIAALPNVSCKLSGMVTEADWHNWKPEDFNNCLEVVTEAFGTNRLMFGSDWPVCLLAASYAQVVENVTQYYSGFSRIDQERIWGKNAMDFYHL